MSRTHNIVEEVMENLIMLLNDMRLTTHFHIFSKVVAILKRFGIHALYYYKYLNHKLRRTFTFS